jgi:Uma2 family endonuclease
MTVGQRRLTLEEFLELPEESPALELIDGMVTQKVAPQWLHGRLQYGAAAIINGFAEPRKLALAFPEIREAHGRDSLVPDIGVYRWERIPRTATGRLTNAPPLPPDIAIEIISPGQTVAEMVDKGRRYLDHGVEIVVIVNPGPETITLLHAGGGPTTVRGEDRIDLEAVLPGFELSVRALFDTLQLD